MKTGLFASVRFEEATGDGYNAAVEKGRLRLSLFRSNLFAWMENTAFRYRDFVLFAELDMDVRNGYSAAGFMMRQIGDSEYYYFLVSTRGYFRFDIVLNGTPEEIIGWTRLDSTADTHISMRIIANGPEFTFIVNDTWAGEATDDRIEAGTISFCAQNYDESPGATVYCRKLTVESRPVEIEESISHAALEHRPSADLRRRLSDSFYASGRYLEGVRQLQKVLVEESGTAEDLFRISQGFAYMGMYTRALEVLEKCLTVEPGHPRARLARADMLYLTNRIDALEPLLPSLIRDFPDNPFLLNLAGNTAFAAGDLTKALEYYLRAAELDKSMPLYLEHAAGALKRRGDLKEAKDLYGQAALRYFRNEDYTESGRIVELLESLGDLSEDMQALKGKLFFQAGETDRAFEQFEELISRGYRDGSVFFLAALALSARGEREKASDYYRAAVDIEGDYYLYWFRLAENSWLLGKDCFDELERALELAPGEGWVLNLAGQVCMDSGDMEKSVDYLRKAVEALPEETDIRINLAEAYFMAGDKDNAHSVLEKGPDNSSVLNYRGNLYSRSGDFEKALECYNAAVGSAPENLEYRENAAAAYIELDMPLKAEEILSWVIEKKPGARSFNLMGNCLGMTGEYKRAEAAYLEALRLDRTWDEPRLNLAELYITLGAADEAQRVLDEGETSSPRADRLKARIRRLTGETIRCSSCGRTWTVPLDLEDQGNLRILGDPPKDLPAGKCPTCGLIYCIECVSGHLENNRFVCPDCGDYLKLNDNRLKFLFNEYFSNRVDSGEMNGHAGDPGERGLPLDKAP